MAKLATFQDPIFQDETKAREALEGVLWPDGPFCRHCGNSDQAKIAKMHGKSHSVEKSVSCPKCKAIVILRCGQQTQRAEQKQAITKAVDPSAMILSFGEPPRLVQETKTTIRCDEVS